MAHGPNNINFLQVQSNMHSPPVTTGVLGYCPRPALIPPVRSTKRVRLIPTTPTRGWSCFSTSSRMGNRRNGGRTRVVKSPSNRQLCDAYDRHSVSPHAKDPIRWSTSKIVSVSVHRRRYPFFLRDLQLVLRRCLVHKSTTRS